MIVLKPAVFRHVHRVTLFRDAQEFLRGPAGSICWCEGEDRLRVKCACCGQDGYVLKSEVGWGMSKKGNFFLAPAIKCPCGFLAWIDEGVWKEQEL